MTHTAGANTLSGNLYTYNTREQYRELDDTDKSKSFTPTTRWDSDSTAVSNFSSRRLENYSYDAVGKSHGLASQRVLWLSVPFNRR